MTVCPRSELISTKNQIPGVTFVQPNQIQIFHCNTSEFFSTLSLLHPFLSSVSSFQVRENIKSYVALLFEDGPIPFA